MFLQSLKGLSDLTGKDVCWVSTLAVWPWWMFSTHKLDGSPQEGQDLLMKSLSSCCILRENPNMWWYQSNIEFMGGGLIRIQCFLEKTILGFAWAFEHQHMYQSDFYFKYEPILFTLYYSVVWVIWAWVLELVHVQVLGQELPRFVWNPNLVDAKGLWFLMGWYGIEILHSTKHMYVVSSEKY